MSTLVEALSVVIPRHVLDTGYPGGTEGYLDTARRARGARYAICDERLACVSFSSPADADSFTAPLSALGLGVEDGAPPPVACLDEDFGPTAPCPWLRWRRHDDGFTSCWLEWTEPGELATPTGWLPPRQRAAASRPVAPRPSAGAPALATPHRAPPATVAPTTIGPLTPISSPAILAAMAGSPSHNGHQPQGGGFPEPDGRVAVAGQPTGAAADTGSPTGSNAAGDVAESEAAGDVWSLPEFEPTALAADADGRPAQDEAATTPAHPADTRQATDSPETYGTTDLTDMAGVVDTVSVTDIADMDALVAGLPSDSPPAPGDDDSDHEIDATAVYAPSDASDPLSAGDALSPVGDDASDDASADTSADTSEDTSVDTSEDTSVDTSDAAGDDRPVIAIAPSPEPESPAASGDDDFEWLSRTVRIAAVDDDDAEVRSAPAMDGEAAAIPGAGWTDVFEVARAALGAIADAAGPTLVPTSLVPPSLTDDDVEALFEAGEGHAAAEPAPEPRPTTVSEAPATAPLSLTPAAMTAVAADSVASAAPSLDAVRAHLAERGWRYSQDAEQPAIFYQTVGGRASYPGFAAADESAQLVWLYTQIPVRVPEHRRAAAVELLTRANHGLAVGNFEFDYTDGEVRFKAVADTADGCFSAAAAGRLLRHSLESCDRYHDALMQVIYGGLSPAEAVR